MRAQGSLVIVGRLTHVVLTLRKVTVAHTAEYLSADLDSKVCEWLSGFGAVLPHNSQVSMLSFDYNSHNGHCD